MEKQQFIHILTIKINVFAKKDVTLQAEKGFKVIRF
jgi:hypothetical protein